MPLVAVTRLHLSSVRFLPMFLVYTIRSARQAQRAIGYRGGWGSNEWPLGFWTATCWADMAAMRTFRNGQPHLTAMRKLLHWCDEASFVHWEQDSSVLPDAAEAYRRLGAEGQLSKVTHPSDRHRAGQTIGTAQPRTGGSLPPRAT